MMLLSYLGPDTLLPMTSVVAAAVGIAAMCGRNTLVLAARSLRRIRRLPSLLARRILNQPTALDATVYRNDQRQTRWRGPVALQRGAHPAPGQSKRRAG